MSAGNQEHVAQEIIRKCLVSIFATGEFSRSPQLRDLLRYLVDATLKGEGDRIKGYTIGVDVFGRGEKFDAGYDSIVRVQAARLRRALENYYRRAGTGDAIRIEIPKGAYQVSFVPNDALPDAGPEELSGPLSEPDKGSAGNLAAARGVTIGVLPFAASDGEGAEAALADTLAEELTAILARNKSLVVAPRSSAFRFRGPGDPREIGRELGVGYLIEGSLHRHDGRVRVTVSLVGVSGGASLWAQTYEGAEREDVCILNGLAARIAQDLRLQLYAEVKLALASKPESGLNDWHLFLLSTWTPGSDLGDLEAERARAEQARRALALNPKSGKAHSVAADKLSHLCNVDPATDTDQNRKEARQHARLALQLEPDDIDVLFNIGLYFWNIGHLERSRGFFLRVLEREPANAIAAATARVLEYGMKPVPHAVMDEIAAMEGGLPQTSAVRWVLLYLLALLHFNNADYSTAAGYAARTHAIRKSPENVFRLAAALLRSGDVKSAVEIIDELRDDWPTVDLRHYARVVVPRRYEHSPILEEVQQAYRDLADACGANGSATGKVVHIKSRAS